MGDQSAIGNQPAIRNQSSIRNQPAIRNPQSESAVRNPQSAIIIDTLLLLMAIIWGTNYSIVKSAFAEIDPYAFNAARMAIASVVFLLVISAVRRLPMRASSVFHTPAAITPREWLGLTALGIVGHAFYQVPASSAGSRARA